LLYFYSKKGGGKTLWEEPMIKKACFLVLATVCLVLLTYSVYSGQSGHLFRFKAATDRSEATLDAHYTSLWPE
jgi:hypothetical protein